MNPAAKVLLKSLLIISVFLGGFATAAIVSTFDDIRGEPRNGNGFQFSPNTRSNDQLGALADLSLSDFELVLELRNILLQDYLPSEDSEVSRDELVQGAIRGMLGALGDRYTVYYSPDEWIDLQEDNAGRFQGVGIRLVPGDRYVEIETPLAGAPAASAGLQALDRVVTVDGSDMTDKNVAEVAEVIRGPEGSSVNLGIFRPRTGERLEFDIERQEIRVSSIELKQTDEGVPHLVLSRFTEDNMSEFRMLWDQAIDEVDASGSDSLILDLRNNTGGWVSAARYVLEEFLPADEIIFKEVDKDGNEVLVRTSRAGKLQDIQLVVLVNTGSASASEIVAGALQDLDRAEIVGEPTLGKGVEQVIKRTSDGGAVFVVFKQWLTPNGRNLSSDEVLQPDYLVEFDFDEFRSGNDNQLQKAVERVL